MTQITIRGYRAEDAPTLWAVYYSAIHQTAAADYSQEQIDAWAPAWFDPSRWAERLRDISPFVAERDGLIVGYADVQTSGYIDHFFVAGDAARQGVGSRLMEQIHSTANATRLESLFSDVSLTARPFFERWGFEVETPQSLIVRGVSLANFRMRKTMPLASESAPRQQERSR